MKVLIIDDHPLILVALADVIRGLAADVAVKGVESAAAARDVLREDPEQDLVLLDLKLGAEDGFDLLAEFRSDHPSLPVVIVSASDRSSDVIRAIDLGAMGFVPKRASGDTLREALRLVMSGGIYVPPLLLAADAASMPAPGSVASFAQDQIVQGVPSLESLGLTPRQEDVLACLLQGMPNKEIARRISLSVETVKDHVAGVLRTLGVSSRTQAVLIVSQMMQQGDDVAALKRPLG